MGLTKLSPYLLILTLSVLSSPPQTLATCGTCSPSVGPVPLPPVTVPPVIEKPPITLPPVIEKPPVTIPPVTIPPVKPPITLPPVIEKPPITLPPVIEKPPVTIPPVTIPPVKPPITLPPVIEKPPITIPVITPPATKKPPCSPPKPKPKPKPCPPTPAAPTSCPIDTIKLGACLDVLGAVVHVGDPAVKCCPLIAGITSVQAAACLCTTIKAKALGINVFLPIAIELLVTCGKTPPPGYKCV